MGVLPEGLVLPYYARADLAWEEAVEPPFPFSPVEMRYTALSGHIDVPVSLFFFLSLGGGVGPVNVRLEILHTQTTRTVVIPAGVDQPRATEWTYSFVTGVASSTTGTSGNVLAPLPPFVLQGEDFLQTVLLNEGINDFIELASLTVIHIPTGPPVANEFPTVAPRATPVI